MLKFALTTLLALTLPLAAVEPPSPEKIHTVYTSLDPLSVQQLLSFYRLYPETDDGREALQRAWSLLLGGDPTSSPGSIQLPHLGIGAIVSLVNRPAQEEAATLTDEELSTIEQAASRLTNRQLPGHQATSEEEVLALPAEEIDIGRALLLSQLEPDSFHQVRSYEAILDLMALQVAAHLPADASPKLKIQAINRFIFEDMGYRFPPHSLYAADIDLYTFLPSVLDSRRGVCLGVSLLYLCLAQRLDLSLEMITPPGHIYIRHHSGINIETTARGIHIPSEQYLSIDIRSLQQRTAKEVIGLAHMNRAAVFWQRGEHQLAISSYKQAKRYLPDDLSLQEFLGYNLLFEGEEKEAKKLLENARGYLPDHAVSRDTITEDYLNGNVNAEGINVIFQHVDETRESILAKQQKLQETISAYPLFRAGVFQLAITCLQLNRSSEALQSLKRYHDLDANNPTVEYYLAALYTHRMNYSQSWHHLQQAEQLTSARNHHPKALKELRRFLTLRYPRYRIHNQQGVTDHKLEKSFDVLQSSSKAKS